jgi:hypothetical protein
MPVKASYGIGKGGQKGVEGKQAGETKGGQGVEGGQAMEEAAAIVSQEARESPHALCPTGNRSQQLTYTDCCWNGAYLPEHNQFHNTSCVSA